MSTGPIVPQTLADFLRSVPYQITGQWFYQKNIPLDGYAFSNCRFDSCNLHVSRGVFRLSHCFMSSCALYYYDEALTVVRLFAGMHVPLNVEINPNLRPISHPDGTISIEPK